MAGGWVSGTSAGAGWDAIAVGSLTGWSPRESGRRAPALSVSRPVAGSQAEFSDLDRKATLGQNQRFGFAYCSSVSYTWVRHAADQRTRIGATCPKKSQNVPPIKN